MRIRLGVSGGNWSAMLSDANAREAFAENVAEVVRKHQLDGLDLDFEWIDQNDTAAWNNYGELARAIRAASPDMFFTIPCIPTITNSRRPACVMWIISRSRIMAPRLM